MELSCMKMKNWKSESNLDRGPWSLAWFELFYYIFYRLSQSTGINMTYTTTSISFMITHFSFWTWCGMPLQSQSRILCPPYSSEYFTLILLWLSPHHTTFINRVLILTPAPSASLQNIFPYKSSKCWNLKQLRELHSHCKLWFPLLFFTCAADPGHSLKFDI